jgi:hypothetical protein
MKLVLTMYRPGTAMLFALTIVETLVGKEKRDEISGPLMVAQTLWAAGDETWLLELAFDYVLYFQESSYQSNVLFVKLQ